MTDSITPIDPRILGKLLLLQTTLHAIPTSEGIAEFVCRGLEEMPGAASTAVRIHDTLKASSPKFAAAISGNERGPLSSNDTSRPEQAGPLPPSPKGSGPFMITIETLHQSYGSMILDARDPITLGAYRPFLESLANTIALTIENRENEINLKRLNEGLESTVRERTREIVAANEALIQEINERKRAEKSLRQSKKFTEILNRISRSFLTRNSDEDMYNDVLRIVLDVMESPFGVFGYINRQGDLVCPSMTQEIWSQCKMSDKSTVFPANTWKDSIWGHGLKTGEPQYTNRRFTVPEGHVPVERCLTVPLLFQKRPIGLLTVANRPRDYTDDDLNMLCRIGEQIEPVLNAMLNRQRSEEDREKLQTQLFQAQKLESIGQLAGGIAHDFNNVLAAIVGYGGLLQINMQPDDPSQVYAEQVLAAAERASGLTQSLLAFSRKQVINPKNIDLNANIQKVDKFLSRIIGEDVSLTMSLCTEPLIIFADGIQIEQVLMNLATNARDAMPKGGSLIISTERIAHENLPVTSMGEVAGSYAMLSVTDTGIGMDEQTQAKIFEPFFTTKEVGRGTGLGLAIVYGVVKQNNGHITVYSEIGRGTTFRIYFSLVAASAEIQHNAAAPATIRGGTETILLAEDDKSIRELARQVLSEYGYSIIEADDGDTALKKFLDHVDDVHLIITDVIMPKKSGRDFCEEARKQKPGVKVIFTSGYPSDLIQKEGISSTDLQFISKPFSPQTLLQKVREALDRSSI